MAAPNINVGNRNLNIIIGFLLPCGEARPCMKQGFWLSVARKIKSDIAEIIKIQV